MNVQSRAIEIMRRHDMADWPTVVENEPLEFREALRAELKIACDRTRAARAAKLKLEQRRSA